MQRHITPSSYIPDMVTTGFTLLETLIAALIASMFLGVIFSVLSQLGRTNAVIDQVSTTYKSATIIYNLLEYELAGVCSPVELREEKTTKTTITETTVEKKPEEKKTTETTKRAATTTVKRTWQPVDETPFVLKMKDNQLDTLSFITCNPLMVYQDPNQLEFSSRLMRVIYRLVRVGTKVPARYTLMRQYGESFALQDYPADSKDYPAYEILTDIQSFSVKLWHEVTEKEQKTWKEASGWPLKGDKDSEQKIQLPSQVSCTVVLYNPIGKGTRTFNFLINIFAQPDRIGDAKNGQTTEQQTSSATTSNKVTPNKTAQTNTTGKPGTMSAPPSLIKGKP